MTPLDQPLYFLMEYAGLVYLLCAAATISCFLLRRSRWITAVWIPSLLVTGGYSLWLVSYVLSQSGDHSPNAGYLGMAVAFGSLFYWPLPATAILLLVAYPRCEAWRFPFLLLGFLSAVVVPLSLYGAFYGTQRHVTFIVTTSSGTPLQGVAFRIPGNPTPIAFTDSSGHLLRRMEHGYDLQGGFSADGYLTHSIAINVAGSQLHVGHGFPKPGTRHEEDYTSEFYPLSRSVQIPIIMKPAPTQ